MDCSGIRDLLPDYSVQMLSRRTHREVEEHLSACAGCRRELEIMDSVVDLIEAHGSLEPPVGLFNGVRNRIESGVVTRERPPWWALFFTVPARAAAMGLAMAAVAFGLWMPASNPTQSPALAMDGTDQLRVSSSELGNSIRQHAMTAAEGPLSDRVAWEAMAQLVSQRSAQGEADSADPADADTTPEF
jgi:predicted anti-sigma-YlaC factor YlaD